MRNCIRLKTNEIPDHNGWFYKQHGGKDPQIRIILVRDNMWRLNAIVRSETVYFSYMQTLTHEELQQVTALLPEAKELLNGS